MQTISLCMIVKNEENTLTTCLGSVKDIVDEIIIVDTGSDDNTKQEALKFTNKIYNFKWVDDFSLARNYSYSKATMDYILWMDADDLILPEDKLKLITPGSTVRTRCFFLITENVLQKEAETSNGMSRCMNIWR